MKHFLTFLTLCGIIDAGYLTYHHYMGDALACVAVNGCQFVTTSEYSVIYGVPLALIGLLYYISLFSIELLYYKTNLKFFLYMCLLICFTGSAVYLYLIYVQSSILHAYCFWCLVSAGLTFLIFALLILEVKFPARH